MIKHEILEVFSSPWWSATLLSVAAILLVLGAAGHLNERGQKTLRIGLGIAYLMAAVLIHPYLVYLGKWDLQSSLPLHLCTLSGILSGVVMLWPRQTGYEFLMYWGLPGGIHSVLTPEFTHGTEGLLIPEYYFLHVNLVLSCLYLTLIVKMKLRKNSWLNVFLWTQLCIPVIGGINWWLGSNYMYLAEKPIVKNPFIIGEWPWYIFILEGVVLFHFYVICLFSRTRKGNFRPAYKLEKA